jgi:hypothetical protein
MSMSASTSQEPSSRFLADGFARVRGGEDTGESGRFEHRAIRLGFEACSAVV